MTESERERRAIAESVAVAAAIAVGAIAWGLISGSRVVLFDGVFVALGMALSWMSLRVSRAVEAGPTKRYPFGRDSLTPFSVAIQGLALLGTLLYAAVDSVLLIIDGGSEVAPLAVAVYGAVTVIASFLIARRARKLAPDSELARAEFAQWRAGMWLSIVMTAGACVALLLVGTRFDGVLPYVDPVLVLIACASLIAMPFGMVRTGINELLEGAPPVAVQREVEAAAEAVREEFGLGAPIVRQNKLGRKLYIEVDFKVEPGQWDVSDEDAVRRAVYDRLDHLGYDIWANVELTTDLALME